MREPAEIIRQFGGSDGSSDLWLARAIIGGSNHLPALTTHIYPEAVWDEMKQSTLDL